MSLESFLSQFEDKSKMKSATVQPNQSSGGNNSSQQQSELDCRNTIKYLILACRSMTVVLLETKIAQGDLSFVNTATIPTPAQPQTPPTQPQQQQIPKQLTPKEIQAYVKLLKSALLSLNIYTLGRKSTSSSVSLQNQKEEKEIIENLGPIYTLFNSHTLQEIFTQTIHFIIEHTFKNPSLAILSSYFLATPSTSCIYATILIDYLLERMDQMGEQSLEKSNLYLKLFKLVFGSVSVFPTENEKMLKPHLHALVNKSLEYALKAKEPYNYFLLMRALFRSIGGGNHDLLYQEFLPLLPVLLQSLNELQTGLHKQNLKDLFVELCLTVPVRLSSLLPYLPMLMDPLVNALNGSSTLVSQVGSTFSCIVYNNTNMTSN